LSDELKSSTSKLSNDFCTISHDGATDYFIRTILEVPIHSIDEPFLWGVWASVSEKSFKRYVETYDEPVEGDGFFGMVSNRLPFYPDTIALPADVVVQTGRERPKLILHNRGSNNHPLVVDQHEGISIARAQQIAMCLPH